MATTVTSFQMSNLEQELDERVQISNVDLDEANIVRASDIIIKPHCYAQRVVLRQEKFSKNSGQFIVHIQLLRGALPRGDASGTGIAFEHFGFTCGSYFRYGKIECRDETESVTAALLVFNERVRKL